MFTRFTQIEKKQNQFDTQKLRNPQCYKRTTHTNTHSIKSIDRCCCLSFWKRLPCQTIDYISFFFSFFSCSNQNNCDHFIRSSFAIELKKKGEKSHSKIKTEKQHDCFFGVWWNTFLVLFRNSINCNNYIEYEYENKEGEEEEKIVTLCYGSNKKCYMIRTKPWNYNVICIAEQCCSQPNDCL